MLESVMEIKTSPEIPNISTRDEIIKIINNKNSESQISQIDDFIEKRQLSLIPYIEQYFPTNNPLTETFIGPKTIIKPNQWAIRGYYFDNDDFTYKRPLIVLSKLNESSPVNQENYENKVLSATFISVIDYFGNITTNQSQIQKRDNILKNNSDLDFDDESKIKVANIKDFREENCGMCLEKAIFAHNLLLLLGLKDTIATGSVYFTESEGKKSPPEKHVFNIFTDKNNNQVIIDFTLAVAKTNPENGQKRYLPYAKLLTPEQKKDLHDRKPISLNYPSDIPDQNTKKITYQLDK